MSTTTVETQSTNTKTNERPDFGSGTFSGEMNRFFDWSQQLLGLSEKQAEKFARQAARDAGEVYKRLNASIKVGKSDKDGKVSIAFAAKTSKGGVTGTNALNLAHTLGWIADAGKHGISWGHTQWKLTEVLQNYVNGLAD